MKSKLCSLVITIAAAILLIGIALIRPNINKVEQPEPKPKFYESAGRYIGIWTDPDTKCDYIVSADGGIHIRYSAEGWHMCEGQYGDGQ